jgi:hypothetical protein
VKHRGTEVVLNGPSWTWFTPPELNHVDEYREGVQEGRSVAWFPSGVRRREGQFVGGQRQGEWREFHPNASLAELAHYERGQPHGQSQRFFASGRKSLQASYEHGKPSGEWRAFYDQPESNVALSGVYRRGREEKPFEGYLPDGSRWANTPLIRPCRDAQGPCDPALDALDLEALPVALPVPCAWGKGRDVPASQRTRVARAAVDAWPKPIDGQITTIAPTGCVQRITLSCAPDLDGQEGAEVLAEIQYRVYTEHCGPVPEGVFEPNPSLAIVVLSPSKPGSTAFTARGLVGYEAFSAGGVEQGSLINGVQFVRLPNGQAALRSLVTTDAGDCSHERVDTLFMVLDGDVRTVTRRTLNKCNGAIPPDVPDLFPSP